MLLHVFGLEDGVVYHQQVDVEVDGDDAGLFSLVSESASFFDAFEIIPQGVGIPYRIEQGGTVEIRGRARCLFGQSLYQFPPTNGRETLVEQHFSHSHIGFCPVI